MGYPAFNRTSMESKHVLAFHLNASGFPFNRTSMESKLTLIIRPSFPIGENSLLIEPVWNRNSVFEVDGVKKCPFNRTSMESKLKQGNQDVCDLNTFNRTSMESKPAL